MRSLMLIGKTGAGKTSLMQRLNEEPMVYHKTQSVSYCSKVIDTPGEYIENRVYYKALIVSSYEADFIGFIQEANAVESLYPPGFAEAFNKEVIGIITKIDLEEDTSTAEKYLREAGVATIVKVSNTTQQGVDAIRDLMNSNCK